MKDLFKLRNAIVLTLSLIILVSCEDDDNDPPSGNSFPITLVYAESTNTEFKLWTNGSEVITSGLNAGNIIDSSDWSLLSPEYYVQADITFTLDEDSLYGSSNLGEDEVYAYFFRNDSLFLEVELIFLGDTITEQYFAIGNRNRLTLNQGYYEYCNNFGIVTECNSNFLQEFVDVQTVEERLELENLVNSLEPADTLIIYNQSVVFN